MLLLPRRYSFGSARWSRTSANRLAVRAAAALCLALASLAPVLAINYDLAADWSDVVNPNGVWAYGTVSGGIFSAFPTHVPNYINVGPAAFSGNQPAWNNGTQTGNNGNPQGLAKSVGNSLFDLPAGRVGGHTPVSGATALAVQWTAPGAGTIDVSGGTWMWRDLNRTETIGLSVKGNPLFSGVIVPERDQGITSGNPFTLAAAIAAAGGTPTALSNISVATGDTLLFVAARGSEEDFVGIDFGVQFTPAVTAVPEAGTFVLALPALGMVVAVAIRRRTK